MPLCPIGVKTTIEWQYPGEAKQKIEGADDYTIETVQNTSLNTSYELVYRQPVISNGALQGWNSTEFKTGIGTFNGISSWRMRYVHAGNVIYENPYSTYLYGTPPNGQNQMSVSIEITSQGTTTTRLIAGQAFGFWGLRVRPINANLQTTTKVFKIYKNGVVVYQKTQPVAVPIVNYFCGEQCPAGTCKCDCGDMVCCYDTTTGRAVKSFLK